MGLGGPKALEMTDEAFRYLAHENYLLRTNALYNYKFRNTSCIADGHCEFPERIRYSISDRFFVMFVLMFPVVGMTLGFLYVGLLYLRGWLGRYQRPIFRFGFAPEEDAKLFAESP
jgi:hypothetical protein